MTRNQGNGNRSLSVMSAAVTRTTILPRTDSSNATTRPEDEDMTNDPMWTDEHDAQPTATPAITNEQRDQIRAGAGIRIVTKAGAVYQGIIESIAGYRPGQPDSLYLHGKRFLVSQHTLYAVATEGITLIDQPRREFTAEELRDMIADKAARNREDGRQVQAVTIMHMVETLIGFDPSVGAPAANFGGKSPDGWVNQFVSLAALKRKLAELVDADILVAVRYGTRANPTNDSRYVGFPFHASIGWVLRTDYEEGKAAYQQKAAEGNMEKLRQQARAVVADRHEAEVEQVLAELVAKQGM
jgi:hypothetical protein